MDTKIQPGKPHLLHTTYRLYKFALLVKCNQSKEMTGNTPEPQCGSIEGFKTL